MDKEDVNSFMGVTLKPICGGAWEVSKAIPSRSHWILIFLRSVVKLQRTLTRSPATGFQNWKGVIEGRTRKLNEDGKNSGMCRALRMQFSPTQRDSPTTFTSTEPCTV